MHGEHETVLHPKTCSENTFTRKAVSSLHTHCWPCSILQPHKRWDSCAESGVCEAVTEACFVRTIISYLVLWKLDLPHLVVLITFQPARDLSAQCAGADVSIHFTQPDTISLHIQIHLLHCTSLPKQ